MNTKCFDLLYELAPEFLTDCYFGLSGREVILWALIGGLSWLSVALRRDSE
jgi:hypothetical protein